MSDKPVFSNHAPDDGDQSVYKAQDVNYLGFLEAQLRDLQGVATLAYELIQNADDVKDRHGAPRSSRISFDVRDEALIVEDDGVFRSVDFERLQNIAGGGKRAEAETTGAFGLGFIAVYQVTDAPEIFSGGRHWIIRPQAPPEQRIEEREAETTGTRIRLPWAFDEASEVRRSLRMPAIRREQLDQFAQTIAEAIELAALFLRQLKLLEVRREGELVRRIERMDAGEGRLRLKDETGRTASWLLFQGDFAAEAERLREQYAWQIEAKRSSEVRLALPVEQRLQHGRLFAVLPTETRTPLPFHINADFYPTTDRKRIHLEEGYQAEWNRAALLAVAEVLAARLEMLPQELGAEGLWHVLQQVAETERQAQTGDLAPIFAAFWQALAPLLSETALLYTAQGAWVKPAEARLVEGVAAQEALPLLEALQIPVVDAVLAPYAALMQRAEVGARMLAMEDLVAALNRVGLTHSTPLFEAPEFLQSPDALQRLWALVDALLIDQPTPQAWDAALAAIGRCAVVLSEMMTLERLDRIYRGKEEARTLFPDVAWVHEMAPANGFPGRYVPNFGVRQAVDRLAEAPVEQLEEAWRAGRLDIRRLFRWFESQQIEIFVEDVALQREIPRLPLYPVEGHLRPLGDLYVPGGFEDPLGLPVVVELDWFGGRRQFLQDLGLQQLDFESYIEHALPLALEQDRDLPSDGRHELLQLLARRLGQIRDDEALRERLSRLPLIPSMDGSFRAPLEVYASRDVIQLLGEQVHVAEPAPNSAVEALYEWLGVQQRAATDGIVAHLLATGRAWDGQKPDEATTFAVRRAWQELDTRLQAGEIGPEALAPLREQPVVLDREGRLQRPDALFFMDSAEHEALFPAVAEQLLSPDGEAAAALAAAGVRPLSQAAQLQVAEAVDLREDEALQERIVRRQPLLRRVLAAEGGPDLERWRPELLDTLRVLRAGRLTVQYRLAVGDELLASKPEAVAAHLDPEANTLYVSYEAQHAPWPAIARELALAIKQERVAGGLAIAIREVLAAPSAKEAGEMLDELGYP